MKRVAVVVSAALMALGLAAPASANVSGSASWGTPLVDTFTLAQSGPLTVTVTWTPKAKSTYRLWVEHLTDPNDLSSQDQGCGYNSYGGQSTPALGSWTCHFDPALAGSWRVTFQVMSGGKASGVTITETLS